jgi:Tol biopolymer transport system component
MLNKTRRMIFLPAAAALLSACGGTPARSPELLSANNSPTAMSASTNAATPIQTAAPLPSPTVEVTLAPAAPFPGLVYTNTEGMGLWIVQADGTAKQLTANTGARLSPDQSTILYVQYGDVWSSELNVTKVLNLTRTNDKIECCAQWWPAHPGIVVFHFQYKNQNLPMAGYLATVKTDGTNFLILDEDIGSMTPAALSPDGQSIAYDRAGQPWIYNFQGGGMPLFRKSAGLDFRVAIDPAWSPDGRKLAWQFYGDQAGTNGWSETAVLDLDTYQVTHLHRYTLHPDSPAYSHLAWSPDGKWLAVAGEGELGQDGKVSLWILPSDGSGMQTLGVGDQPVWSPDGTLLIYQSGNQTLGMKAGEWIPFPVTLPAEALVTDWVTIK